MTATLQALDCEQNDRTVLIINDETDMADALRWLLEPRGYNVEVACDGLEGMRKLHAGLRPCLILLDVRMPIMDGFEFRERQLSDPELAGIPVIVLSAALDDRGDTPARLRADAYLEGVFDLDSLLELVNQHALR